MMGYTECKGAPCTCPTPGVDAARQEPSDAEVDAWANAWAKCWNGVALRLPQDVLQDHEKLGVQAVALMRRARQQPAPSDAEIETWRTDIVAYIRALLRDQPIPGKGGDYHIDRAVALMRRAGKPPIGRSPAPLLRTIDGLKREVATLGEFNACALAEQRKLEEERDQLRAKLAALEKVRQEAERNKTLLMESEVRSAKAWVIRRADRWWGGKEWGDSVDAIRFARHEDAQRVINELWTETTTPSTRDLSAVPLWFLRPADHAQLQACLQRRRLDNIK